MRRVLITQAQMKQYRVPFFDGLRVALEKENVRLKVAYSAPTEAEAQKGDNPDLSPEYGIKVKGYWFFGNRVLYQPLLREIARADLVIVEQANKHLLNHVLVALSALGLKRVAFWGHGRNWQSRGASLSEWIKVKTLRHVDWWFAYTVRTKSYLDSLGISSEKITVVENAIDTKQFCKELESISEEERKQACRSLAIPSGSRVGLFCASITPQKRPEFLIASALRIKELVPCFELLVVGAGPREQLFREAAGKYSWIHLLGPQFGRNKALYYRISEVALMPCAVGLGILDAFAAGLPLLTTNDPAHGPEIEYLQDGANGLSVEPTVDKYSQAVAALLSDAARLGQLRAAALQSSERYSIRTMVDRFVSGILQCLQVEPRSFVLAPARRS